MFFIIFIVAHGWEVSAHETVTTKRRKGGTEWSNIFIFDIALIRYMSY